MRRLWEEERKVVYSSNVEPRILFEDEWILVVDKPRGMIVNNAKTVGDGQTIQGWFSNKLKVESGKMKVDSEFFLKGGVVHRLDKDTSGVLILAKTEEAYNRLKEQFLERRVTKTYVALVHGEMKPEEGTVSLPIERHPKIWGKFAVGTDLSRTAITEWKVKQVLRAKGEVLSLLELKPLTGRTHQLRVHLKHLGHPIVADPIYVGKRVLASDQTWCLRLFLHAAKLELLHPITGEKMHFEAKLPGNLARALETLQ